ncbi:MAG: carbohydrate ABC transporter permease [Lachnospiraceae bacterium]|nr:carbohydrate ABC transporter permease [uncultured Acetatifactor sp.]MCI8543917.1 carbohydrate ABC transporter permease [Lachnospiraceae bacterium]
MIESKGQKIFRVFNYTFLGLLGLATFYPFWYVLVASLNEGRDFMRGGVWFFPRAFTWENYAKAFNDDRIGPSLKISVEATLITVVVSLLLTALVAYALTVKTLPGRNIFSFFWYFTTIFSGGMIPYFIVLRDLKLTSSFWLYVIPGLFSFSNFILMRANFSGIPYELRESAQLDGAGEWTILSRIYLPLSKPILATLALFIGVGKWNDWFTGAYYQSQAKLYPAATVLQRLLAEASAGSQVKVGQETAAAGGMTTYTSQSLQMAFVMILTMPIVVVYPFLQKYYVKGVMVGSVKG